MCFVKIFPTFENIFHTFFGLSIVRVKKYVENVEKFEKKHSKN